MNFELKPYPEMKDSCMPWLGEIPEHWEVRRNGRIFAHRIEMSFPDLPILEVSLNTGIRVRNLENPDRKQIMSNRDQYKHAAQRDIVYNMMRMWQGAVGVVPVDGLVSPAYVVARPFSEAESRYYSYLFKTATYMNEVNKYSHGIVADRNRLYWAEFKQMPSTFPPLEEQQKIADFLDCHYKLVRHVIQAKQKLIKLLEEQKQVIIHQAITRGLDPTVPLKPSGVEWLGDVPVHWDIVRNGRLFIQRNEAGYSQLPILEVSLRTGVRVRDFESSDRKQIINDRDKYKHAARGDIAYNMMRMWQGAVGVVPVDGLVSPAYVVAKPMKGTESRYYSALFGTREYMGEVDKYSHGIVKDRNRLYWEDFKQMQSIFPPLNEQIIIADAIDKNSTELGLCIRRIMHEISLITEYRDRLISDVVTGKIDVRGIDLPATIDADVPQESSDLLEDESDMADQVIQEEITICQGDGE